MMSAEYVGLGFTVEGTRPTLEEMLDAIETHEGAVDETFGQGAAKELRRAAAWLADPSRYSTFWLPNTDRRLVASGGMTPGDEPFDEFYAVCRMVSAAVNVPALGEALGIVGWGVEV